MTPRLLFVHGWALGPDLWDGVAACLGEPAIRLDLGYFGQARLEERPPAPYVAVGHSLGVLWLLRHWPQGCAGLVALNGFARFAAGPGFPEGSPLRPLDRMIARFAQEPEAVAAAFLDRCGAPPPPRGLDAARALEGLHALRTWDERAACAGRPILALCGQDDPVAPPELSRAALPGAELRTLRGQGHLLPLTAPQACADAVAALLARVSS